MVLPIAALVIGAILITKGFTKATLSEIINGDLPEDAWMDTPGAASYTAAVPGLGNSAPTTSMIGSIPIIGGILSNVFEGSPVPGIKPHSSTHPTSGLSGYPAYDYMASPGTPTVAPVAGRVTKVSGKDPKLGGLPGGALGYSIYISGNNGRKYFLTHLDSVRVKAGDVVAQGQQIATVANGPKSWSTPHVHMGVN